MASPEQPQLIDRKDIPESVKLLERKNGRILSYRTYGNPKKGLPVFFFPGSPGSCLGPIIITDGPELDDLFIVVYDRPGYGLSDSQESRTIAESVEDTRALADHLQIPQFYALARSGGGPYALATAALLPDRVIQTAVFACPAPEGEGFEWERGIWKKNEEDFTMNNEQRRADYTRIANNTREDPESHIRTIEEHATEEDKRIIALIRPRLAQGFAFALQNGPEGWLDDYSALHTSWGFDLRSISGNVLIWQAGNDLSAPRQHGERLSQLIPNSTLLLEENASHFNAYEALARFLGKLP